MFAVSISFFVRLQNSESQNSEMDKLDHFIPFLTETNLAYPF